MTSKNPAIFSITFNMYDMAQIQPKPDREIILIRKDAELLPTSLEIGTYRFDDGIASIEFEIQIEYPTPPILENYLWAYFS